MILFFFFFFQAEDGIRDKLVTGVQTCALPISKRRRWDGESTNCLPKANRPRLRRWVLFAANNRGFYRPLLDKCNCHSVCGLALRESARTRSRLAPHRLFLFVRTL